MLVFVQRKQNRFLFNTACRLQDQATITGGLGDKSPEFGVAGR